MYGDYYLGLLLNEFSVFKLCWMEVINVLICLILEVIIDGYEEVCLRFFMDLEFRWVNWSG